MGGNALKNINVTRMNVKEFNETKDKVLAVLNELKLEATIPKFFKSKDSFGDVDVIIKTTNSTDYQRAVDRVNEVFKPKDFYRNGSVYSFDVDNHQVDLIFTPEKDYETSVNYLSYNDLFNLLGRLAHKLGLKLGHKGLLYVIRNGDYTLGEVELVKDLKSIFKILDVDIDTYNKGFENADEIFEFVMKSKYFSNQIFAYENLNNINRVRNKKRVVYRDFLKYIRSRPKDGLTVDKEVFVKELLEEFPEAKVKVQKLWDRLVEQRAVKKIFNGDIVKELKNVEGPELGKWMIHFKKKYDNKFWLEHKDNAKEIILKEKLV